MSAADRFAAIRAREQAATVGPWRVDPNEFDVGVAMVGPYTVGWDEPGEWHDTDEQARADADFIAHTREDVPFLLAVVDYLDRLYPLAVRAAITDALGEQ